MSSFKGMAADHVLSFEVITTTGQFINASATENSDLFFALRGGVSDVSSNPSRVLTFLQGGGTYGIVWSVTSKAFKDVVMSVATFNFNEAENGEDLFWQGQRIYHAITPNFTAAGVWGIAFHGPGFIIGPAFMYPNHTVADFTALTKPLFDAWDKIGLKYSKTLTQYDGYLKAVDALPDFTAAPVNNAQYGGRLLPLSLWDSPAKIDQLVAQLKKINSLGYFVADIATTPKLLPTSDGNSAVYPQWRTAQRHFLLQAYVFSFNVSRTTMMMI
jgi:hypothetical protein